MDSRVKKNVVKISTILVGLCLYLFYPASEIESDIGWIDWCVLLVGLFAGYHLIFRSKKFGELSDALLVLYIVASPVFMGKFVLYAISKL